MDWKRAGGTALFVAFCFSIGISQRVWEHRGLKRFQKQDEAFAQINAAVKAEQERLERELAELPPDARQFFQGVFYDARTEIMSTPIVTSLSRTVFPRTDNEEADLETARRRYELLAKSSSAAADWSWILAIAVAAWCLGASMFGFPQAALPVGRACVFFSRVWLFVLACSCAFWAGISLRNPWRAVPLGFYAAPLIALFGCVLSNLGAESNWFFDGAVACVEAPAAAFVLSVLAAALA